MAFVIVFFLMKFLGFGISPAGPGSVTSGYSQTIASRVGDWIKGLIPLSKEVRDRRNAANEQLDLASKKFEEYKKLIESGKTEEAKNALLVYQEYMNKALLIAGQLTEEKETAVSLVNRIKNIADENLDYLKLQGNNVPPEIKGGIGTVLNGIESGIDFVRKKLGL